MSKPVSVEILVVGNEILIGDIQDTNTNWICKLINSRGGYVARATMLRDIPAEIAAATRAAIERGVDVLITSGGLGPTADDLTVAAVAEGAGLELRLDEQARQMVKERYDEFFEKGIMAQGGLNPAREKMAWLPVGAEPLHNPVGTAPGVLFRVGKTTIICLPGVPSELKGIITTSLEPFFHETLGDGGSLAKAMTVRCNDESILEPVLSRVVPSHPRVYIKSLARTLGETPELDITLTVTGGEEEERILLVNAAYRELREGLKEIGIDNWDKA
ncbi:MAG: competence/damage-inducible protein A [Geobacteraceae bacterium]|nr:competence/damage-inducible protein A [Geobacteraceae bacterium]